MGEGARAAGSPVDRTPEEIRADIEGTRAELGDTVEALAEKTDVKTQARQRFDELKRNLRARAERLKTRARTSTPESAQKGREQVVAKVRENPAPAAIGGAIVLGFLLGRITGRGRRDC